MLSQGLAVDSLTLIPVSAFAATSVVVLVLGGKSLKGEVQSVAGSLKAEGVGIVFTYYRFWNCSK